MLLGEECRGIVEPRHSFGVKKCGLLIREIFKRMINYAYCRREAERWFRDQKKSVQKDGSIEQKNLSEEDSR